MSIVQIRTEDLQTHQSLRWEWMISIIHHSQKRRRRTRSECRRSAHNVLRLRPLLHHQMKGKIVPIPIGVDLHHEAGAAAHHQPTADDAGGCYGDHAPPSRRRPHRWVHRPDDGASSRGDAHPASRAPGAGLCRHAIPARPHRAHVFPTAPRARRCQCSPPGRGQRGAHAEHGLPHAAVSAWSTRRISEPIRSMGGAPPCASLGFGAPVAY